MVRSDEEAEKWWLKAGGEETKRGEQSEDEEHIESVVRAQNTLGMFYSREETSDFRKVPVSSLIVKIVVWAFTISHYVQYYVVCVDLLS